MDSLLPYKNWIMDPKRRGSNLEEITNKQIEYITNLLSTSKNFSLEAFEEVIEVPLLDMNKHDASFIIKCLTGEIQRLSRCECGKPANIVVSLDYACVNSQLAETTVCEVCAMAMLLNQKLQKVAAE